jgi:hypothetical protein
VGTEVDLRGGGGNCTGTKVIVGGGGARGGSCTPAVTGTAGSGREPTGRAGRAMGTAAPAAATKASLMSSPEVPEVVALAGLSSTSSSSSGRKTLVVDGGSSICCLTCLLASFFWEKVLPHPTQGHANQLYGESSMRRTVMSA